MKGKRVIALVLIAALSVTGCATMNNGKTASDDGKCAGTAVAGALAGALIGALLSKNKLQGAALGAAGGGLLAGGLCLAVTSEVRQTKSSEQVELEFKQSNGGDLPLEPTVKDYSTSIVPSSGVLHKGENLLVQSRAQVVGGRNAPIETVEEVVELKIGGESSRVLSKEMPYKGSGAYETVHTIGIPPKFQDGTYIVASSLKINGKPTGVQREGSLRIASGDDGVRFAVLEFR